jgi:hypothetical protein
MKKYKIGILVFLLFIAVGASFTVTYFYLDGGLLHKDKGGHTRLDATVPKVSASRASVNKAEADATGVNRSEGTGAQESSEGKSDIGPEGQANTDRTAVDGPRVPQSPTVTGGRYVTIRGGYVAVYTRAPAEGGQLFQLHPIDVAKLPYSERAQLERGIRVKDDKEVLDLLEAWRGMLE